MSSDEEEETYSEMPFRVMLSLQTEAQPPPAALPPIRIRPNQPWNESSFRFAMSLRCQCQWVSYSFTLRRDVTYVLRVPGRSYHAIVRCPHCPRVGQVFLVYVEKPMLHLNGPENTFCLMHIDNMVPLDGFIYFANFWRPEIGGAQGNGTDDFRFSWEYNRQRLEGRTNQVPGRLVLCPRFHRLPN